MKNLRKTHPTVLIAAIALTFFSLIGSAAITGLIPSAAQTEVRNRVISQSSESRVAEPQGQYRKENVDQLYQGIQRLPSNPLVVVQI